MFDDLLGRTALKEEIATLEAKTAELESEKASLEERLESEKQRRKDAVTERQEAQRRVNKLEDRIEQLEDQRDRLQSEDHALTVRREEQLQGGRLAEVLDRLASFETEPEGAMTAYVADEHQLPAEIRDAFGERAALVSRAAPCLAIADDAGLVAACLRTPVPPEEFLEWADSFHLEREWFLPRGRYTLALVRSDLFAMGTYQGDERTGFHGFDSDLKSQHSKGGYSQARFERLRDEQIDNHLERCVAALEERETDRLFVVGERSVLGEVTHLADVSTTVDATGDPETALEKAWQDFWTVQFRAV